MCTVTFVPVKGGALLASNRDEKNMRKPALPPSAYPYGTTEIVYPRDAQAGGTWIAMKENGDAAILLNGALKKHVPQPPYARSRGIVLIDILKDDRPVEAFLRTGLENIEPFTLILFIKQALTECRWDGREKQIKHLSPARPHIWSSSTLYSDDIVLRRESWFKNWLGKNANPTVEDIFNFHRFGGDGDKQNDLIMKRDNAYQTVSITVLELIRGSEKMIYHDLLNDLCATQQINTYAHELF